MIRPFRPEDAEFVAALLHEDELPEAVTGPGILHWHEGQPERARAGSWVAVEDGAIVGWARARLAWATSEEGVGELWAFVRPVLRRNGIGATLSATAEARLEGLGARIFQSWTNGSAGEEFLRGRGYRPTRSSPVLRLDLSSLDLAVASDFEAAKAAEGFAVVPLADVLDRPRELFAVDAEAIADIPETFVQDDVRFEDWLDEALGHPQLSLEGSFVVLSEGRPVAHALLHVDPRGGLAANEMTGTARSYRRRGLARLAKLASIRWALTNGFRAILTETDETNAGMRALNRSLGYRQVATETEFLRE